MALVTLALALVLPASGASAVETELYGVAPAPPPNGGPRPSTLRVSAHGGETVTGGLQLWSRSDTSLALHLRVAGATPTPGGRFEIGAPTGAAEWVELGEDRVVLDPDETVVVPFTVHAPGDLDTTVEEHLAALVVEPDLESGDGISVLPRVSTVVHIEPLAGPPPGSGTPTGIWPARGLALALLAGAAGALLTARRSRRGARTTGATV